MRSQDRAMSQRVVVKDVGTAAVSRYNPGKDHFASAKAYTYLMTKCGNQGVMTFHSFLPDLFCRAVASCLERRIELSEAMLLVGFDGEDAIDCDATGIPFRPVRFIRPDKFVELEENGRGVVLSPSFLDALRGTGSIEEAIKRVRQKGSLVYAGCFLRDAEGDIRDNKSFEPLSGSPVLVPRVERGTTKRVTINKLSHLGSEIISAGRNAGAGRHRVEWGWSRDGIEFARDLINKEREEQASSTMETVRA